MPPASLARSVLKPCAQGPRNLTIMATITRNSYYALRNNCPIMESGSRDRSPIIVSYYEKKSPITLNST